MRWALLVIILLAGCTTPLPDPSEALRFRAPVPVSKEWPGAEPVVAVGADGTIYVEGIGRAANGNVNKVWRSDDGGASWTDITPPAMGQERSNDGFVAVSDDGTVFAANVFSLTFQVYRSDDKGATWTPINVPRLPALMHRHWIIAVGDTVHVTVEALPPAFAPFLGGVPPPTSQLGTANEGMWYARSDDDGASWTTPVQIDPVVNFAGQSNMVASADGQKLYVGRYQEAADPTAYTYESGHWYLLASEDGGDTWDRREMFDLTSELSTAVPGLALDPDGRLAFAWSQAENGLSRVRVAYSRDAGLSWSEPRPFLAPGTHAMAFAAARGPDEWGIMWYAADASGTASKVDAEWRVHYALLRGDEVQTVVVTPEPVHDGNICAKGPACGEGEDRSLLDYPWIDFGPLGDAHLVFASTEWDRPSAFAVFAREMS